MVKSKQGKSKVKCDCIGKRAEMEAKAIADRIAGDMESLRDKFIPIKIEILSRYSLSQVNRQLRNPEKLSAEAVGLCFKEVDMAWQEFIKIWFVEFSNALDLHPLKNKPDTDCEECGGTGKMPNYIHDFRRLMGGTYESKVKS